jgi:hypothetical protein
VQTHKGSDKADASTWAERLEVAVPLTIWGAAAVSGATYSSIGVEGLRENSHAPLGAMWGTAQPIRSDEFLTQAAQELAVLDRGHSIHSVMAQSSDITFQISSGQFFESVMFVENNLLRLGPWLPDSMLFAAVRLLPMLLVALTLPRLLRRFGATRPLSWLGFFLVAAAPAAAWWSFTPIRILSFVTVGGMLLIWAHDRWGSPRRSQRLAAVVLAALGGMYFARLATYYVPWGLSLGVPIMLAVAAYLLWGERRKAGWAVLAIGALSGAVMLALVFAENRDAVEATLNTVYPGSRRSGGYFVGWLLLFGAPGLPLTSWGQSAVAVGTNATEISSSYAFCGVWALVLLAVWRRKAIGAGGAGAALVALTLATVGWAAWCMLSWGSWGPQIPGMSLVPAFRAAQTLGVGAALVLVLVLSRVGRQRWWVAVVAALACAFVTVIGVSGAQGVIEDYTATAAWVSALVVAVVVVAVTRWPQAPLVIAAVCVLLVMAVIRINPVNFGLGDLRASSSAGAAREIAEQMRHEGGRVATDDMFVGSLFFSNGAPMVSGWQISGPNLKAWHLLDPQDSDIDAWNRGASYLVWTFTGAPGSRPKITAPTTDVILVKVDPCAIPEGLNVKVVVASGKLHASCLVKRKTIRWGDRNRYVYDVQR